jgi:hypothetical protein
MSPWIGGNLAVERHHVRPGMSQERVRLGKEVAVPDEGAVAVVLLKMDRSSTIARAAVGPMMGWARHHLLPSPGGSVIPEMLCQRCHRLLSIPMRRFLTHWDCLKTFFRRSDRRATLRPHPSRRA